MSSEQRPGPVPRSFDEIREMGMTPEDEALLEREKEEAAAAGEVTAPAEVTGSGDLPDGGQQSCCA